MQSAVRGITRCGRRMWCRFVPEKQTGNILRCLVHRRSERAGSAKASRFLFRLRRFGRTTQKYTEATMEGTNVREVVKGKYGQAALRVTGGGSSCCGATVASS